MTQPTGTTSTASVSSQRFSTDTLEAGRLSPQSRHLDLRLWAAGDDPDPDSWSAESDSSPDLSDDESLTTTMETCSDPKGRVPRLLPLFPRFPFSSGLLRPVQPLLS